MSTVPQMLLSMGGILGLSYGAVANISTTVLFIPPMLLSPSRLLATQWQALFKRGAATVIPTVTGAGIAFATLAYLASQKDGPQQHRAVQEYTVAALCSFCLGPYTLGLMGSTNNTLLSIADKVRKEGADGSRDVANVHNLVQKWSSLNLGRGIMLLVGAIAGIHGTVLDA